MGLRSYRKPAGGDPHARESHSQHVHSAASGGIRGSSLGCYPRIRNRDDLLIVRPWHTRWRATSQDVRKRLPGDELVPNPTLESTRAITIRAPAEEVWRWLVQLGQDRGGFYSYDRLENLAGADIHNVDWIVPQMQHLKVGDFVPMAPVGQPTERQAHSGRAGCPKKPSHAPVAGDR